MANEVSQNPPSLDYVTLGDSHVYAVLGTVTPELPPVTLTIARGGFQFHDYLTVEDARQLAAALLEQAAAVTRAANAQASRSREPVFDQATLSRIAQAKVTEAGRTRKVVGLRYHETIAVEDGFLDVDGSAHPPGEYRVEWPPDGPDTLGRSEIGLSHVATGHETFQVEISRLAENEFTVTEAPTDEPF